MYIQLYWQSWVLLISSVYLMQKATNYMMTKGIFTRDKTHEFQKEWFRRLKERDQLGAYALTDEYYNYMLLAMKDTFIMFIMTMIFLWIMNLYPLLITINSLKIWWYEPLLILFAYKIILWAWAKHKVKKNNAKTKEKKTSSETNP